MSVVAPAISLDDARGSRDRAVRRLGYGDPLILRAFQPVHQARGIVRLEQAVRIEGKDVVGVLELQPLSTRGDGAQLQGATRTPLPVPAAHQREVAVQVHRLVGRMRKVAVTLALEAGEVHIKEPGQPAVMAEQLGLGNVRLAPESTATQFAGGLEVCSRGIPQVALDEKTLGVVTRGVGIGLASKPIGGPLVEPGQRECLVRRAERARCQASVCCLGGRLKVPSGTTKKLVEFVHKRTGSLDGGAVLWTARLGRIIDQEDHPPSRVVLERCREKRMAHDVRLFLVRRNQNRERGGRPNAEPMELGGPGVAEIELPSQPTEPGGQIHQPAVDQERDDEEEDGGLCELARSPVRRHHTEILHSEAGERAQGHQDAHPCEPPLHPQPAGGEPVFGPLSRGWRHRSPGMADASRRPCHANRNRNE